jgi:murein hydrolase activator
VQAIFSTMSMIHRLSALSLVALVATAGLAVAQEAEVQQLETVQKDLTVSAERQQQLLAKATAAVLEQDELATKLVALAETAQAQESKLAAVEKRQSKLKDEIAVINLDLAAKQDVIAHILAGLQRLEQNPPPALVVAPDDVLGALRGAMVFGAIVPELRQAARNLHDQLAELKSLREQLAVEADDHAEALTALALSRSELDRLIAEKQALALSSRAELAAEKQRAEELAEKATSLKQLLEDLAIEKAKAEAKQSAEAKARAEAERILQEKALKPTMAFSKSQGQLTFPAQGQILKLFGAETGLGSAVDGIVIATQKQAQVTSPVAGKVEFAGKFRSYGQMVIVNPGEGYLVLLAGMDQTSAQHGQSIKVGEPVGIMGVKPGKLALSNGLTQVSTPVLYVEFRKNGDPVDPAPWWIGNRQEAMR